MSFEKLRVYQAARELRREVDKLRKALDMSNEGFVRLFVHVEDAVDSIANNIAEGSDSVYPAKRASFYDIAVGSSKEARAGIKSLGSRGAFGRVSIFRAVVLTMAISKMLSAMIARLRKVKTRNP